jgi:hypothetical protein
MCCPPCRIAGVSLLQFRFCRVAAYLTVEKITRCGMDVKFFCRVAAEKFLSYLK